MKKTKLINKLLTNPKLPKKANSRAVCRAVIIVNSIMSKYIHHDGNTHYTQVIQSGYATCSKHVLRLSNFDSLSFDIYMLR